jgi:hypothetical protein
MRLGHGAARNKETFADREILEPARFRDAVLARVKGLGHRASVGYYRFDRSGSRS